MNFNEEMKRVLLAGIGAIACTAEKASGLVDEFVKKGELTVEQGKVLNEELKHKAEQAVKEHVTVTVVKEQTTQPKAEDILGALDKLSPDELDALKKKLSEMEKTHECDCDTDDKEA